MEKPFLLAILLVCNIICHVHSAHILFYHQIASYSHQQATYPLADALSKRGHQVTYITPWYHKGPHPWNPNITLIVPEKFRQTIENFADLDFHINHRVEKKFPRIVHQFIPTAVETCREILQSEELARWVETTKKLDLMIMDNCYAECGTGISYKFGAKRIIFNTIVHLEHEYDQFGFLPESSSIPELEIWPPQTPMTFLERVENTLITLHFRWSQYSYNQEIDEIVRKWVKKPDMPRVDELVRNASLILYTGDIISDYPRSHPPFVVNVGGIHCEAPGGEVGQELPPEIEKFLGDGGKDYDGFIYISFGGVALSSKLPEEVKQVFFDTISEFPRLKFLWKWNGAEPEGKYVGKNVYLAKWFPQRGILGDERIKGFITQGGRPSTMEALCEAVPMVTFPVLADQDVNANRMEKLGGTVKLELGVVTREELKRAVERMAYDKGVKERVEQLRDVLRDQPMGPLDKAVWWTEYVLRHKDTSHLKPSGFEQWWWQRRLLDVWGLMFLIGVGGVALIGLCIGWCLNLSGLVKTSKIKKE